MITLTAERLLATSEALNQMKKEINTLFHILRGTFCRAHNNGYGMFEDSSFIISEENGITLKFKCRSTNGRAENVRMGIAKIITGHEHDARVFDDASCFGAQMTIAVHNNLNKIVQGLVQEYPCLERELESLCSQLS